MSALRETSMLALATTFAEHSCEDKPYVVAALDDQDRPVHIGAYGIRRMANARATRAANQNEQLRVYVVCPRLGGGCVAMSGDYIMGEVGPA